MLYFHLPILALHHVTATANFDVLPRVGSKNSISVDKACLAMTTGDSSKTIEINITAIIFIHRN
jgi:hypothetical protein